jgi:hypothetical protein
MTDSDVPGGAEHWSLPGDGSRTVGPLRFVQDGRKPLVAELEEPGADNYVLLGEVLFPQPRSSLNVAIGEVNTNGKLKDQPTVRLQLNSAGRVNEDDSQIRIVKPVLGLMIVALANALASRKDTPTTGWLSTFSSESIRIATMGGLAAKSLLERKRGFERQVERKLLANLKVRVGGRWGIRRNEDRGVPTVQCEELGPHAQFDLALAVRQDVNALFE